MELLEGVQLLLISIAAAFVFVRLIGKPNRKVPSKQPNLPPEPPSWPVIGHLPVFAASLHPQRELHRLSEQYGPILHLRLGGRPVVLISSVDLAREVLKTQDLNFASRPHSSAFDYDFMEGSIGSRPYGPRWRYLRKIATVELLSHRRVEEFQVIRKQEMSSLVRSIFDDIAATNNDTHHIGVNLYEKLSCLSMNLMTRVVMGKRFFHAQPTTIQEQASSAEAAEFKGLMKELVKVYGTQYVGDHSPYLAFLDWFPKRQLKTFHGKLGKFLGKILDEHRLQNNIHTKPEAEQDFMDVLLSLQDEDGKPLSDTIIKGLALGLTNAGVDTVTVAAEWVLAEVIRNPRIKELAQQELDSVVGEERRVQESDLAKLPYLHAIVKETFRLHPVSGLLLPHAAVESCQLAGYDIPAGMTVFVSSWSLGRDKGVWENPLEFIPERFLGSEIDGSGKHFQFLPYGSGRRMCAGMEMGSRHVHLAVAHLLHCFAWSLPQGQKPEDVDMTETYGLTFPKAIPMHAVPSPRLPLHLY